MPNYAGPLRSATGIAQLSRRTPTCAPSSESPSAASGRRVLEETEAAGQVGASLSMDKAIGLREADPSADGAWPRPCPRESQRGRLGVLLAEPCQFEIVRLSVTPGSDSSSHERSGR